MTTHAVLAASASHRWMECLAAPLMEKDITGRGSSAYAAEGTLAHAYAAHALGLDENEGNAYLLAQVDAEQTVDEHVVSLDEQDMESVKLYVDGVRNRAERAIDAYVECTVPVGLITGEPEATGTADAVLVYPDLFEVCDLKFGKGVWVEAKDNKQLLLYAAAVFVGVLKAPKHIKRVRLVIHQPRIFPEPSEWECSIEALWAFVDEVKIAAGAALGIYRGVFPPEYAPGEETCQFCRAKTKCPALAQAVANATSADFDDMTQTELPKPPTASNPDLEQMMLKVGLVEDWCKAVRAEVETQLLQGATLEHYKLVQGRKSPRRWLKPESVEELMKSWRFKQDEIYDRKLISPTTAERLMLKDKPKRWKALQEHITQAEGKPHVAPMNDKRPAITASAADFDNLT